MSFKLRSMICIGKVENLFFDLVTLKSLFEICLDCSVNFNWKKVLKKEKVLKRIDVNSKIMITFEISVLNITLQLSGHLAFVEQMEFVDDIKQQIL